MAIFFAYMSLEVVHVKYGNKEIAITWNDGCSHHNLELWFLFIWLILSP